MTVVLKWGNFSLASRGQLLMSGDIFGFRNWGRRCCLYVVGRSRGAANSLRGPGRPPPQRIIRPNVKGAEAENPVLRDPSQLLQHPLCHHLRVSISPRSPSDREDVTRGGQAAPARGRGPRIRRHQPCSRRKGTHTPVMQRNLNDPSDTYLT